MSENTLISIAVSCAFFLGFICGMLGQYFFNFSEFKKYPDQGERETNLPRSKLDRG